MNISPSENRIDRLTALSPAKRALLELRLKQKESSQAKRYTIPRRADHATPLLSFAQQRLWFLDQFEPESPIYNIPAAFRLRGPLQILALEQSLNEIVRRHEVLRTTIVTREVDPIQVIHPFLPIALPIIDLTDRAEHLREVEAQRLVEAETQYVFDLSQGPLFRVQLLQLGEEEHILLLNLHHIISDAWSMEVLYRELGQLYMAFVQGQPSMLPELPIQYADYAVWQRQELQGEDFARHLVYWKEQLRDSPALLELPTDRPRSAAQTFHGAYQSLRLPAPLVEGLKQVSRQEQVTLYMTTLAALQTLLWRYTRQEVIAVGSPIAGRQYQETEGLIGFFVNTVVLKTDLSGHPSFRELLARVRQTTLGAYEHQGVPFEKLVEELQPTRNLSYSPLFQLLFAFQNVPSEAVEFTGVTLTPIPLSNTTAKFDLSLYVTERAGALDITLEYNTDLFDPSTAKRMLGQYQTLLEGIVANPDTTIASVSLLTPAERHQLLVEWNATTREYNHSQCVHELIEAQVERTPEAIAVVYEGQQLTYRELNARANQLAHHLRTLGVGPETWVGVSVERSLDMVVGVLGVLKAGGAYVPLDPSYPAERIALMLEDAQPLVLLTQTHLRDILPAFQGHIVCVDTLWEEGNTEGRENLLRQHSPEHLMYMIYTSGSTGKPKGVQVPHRGVVNFLESMRREPGLNAQDHLLSVTTLSFDIAGLEIFLPLVVGATVEVVSREVAADGEQLRKRLETSTATVLQATPVTWRLLIAAGWQGSSRLKILCGGEAMAPDLAMQLCTRGAEVWNMYGPTETTIWSTAHRVQGEPGAISIGRPIANTQVYILDTQGQPVPIGVPGELHIGGAGVTRGYYQRPELTAEKFIADPFSVEPGARLYKTGDLARYRADGTIECLGRSDHQVKLRGFRIELEEISSIVSAHPEVRESVVVMREDRPDDKRLVAYVVAETEAQPTGAELRKYARARLPEYMVPTTFVLVAVLPRTPNGKVDRKALPAPDTEFHGAESTSVTPRTKIEEVLAAIWSEVLNRQAIGVYDNFFELGGHSLLATQLISRVRKSLVVELPLRSLFEAPTVAGLATTIESLLWATQEQSPIVIGGNRSEGNRQTTFEFLTHLRTQHIEVAIDGDRFQVNTSNGVLTAEVQRELSQRKGEILNFLRSAKTWAEPISSLIPLQPAGKRLPIFGVPGHNGDVFCYMPLVQELGSEQPFYGLQPPGADGKREPLTSVEELAAYFLNDIRTFQPEGPYLISGYCLGGFTAFEMARQLDRAGQEVAFLGLFGTQSPAAMTLAHRVRRQIRLSVQRPIALAKILWRMSFQETMAYVRAKMKQRWLEQEKDVTLLLHNPNRLRIVHATVKAVQRYQPGMYSGCISLFLPNRHQTSLEYGRLLEWKNWTSSRCENEFGPPECTSDTMLRELYVKVFADFLRARLERIAVSSSDVQSVSGKIALVG